MTADKFKTLVLTISLVALNSFAMNNDYEKHYETLLADESQPTVCIFLNRKSNPLELAAILGALKNKNTPIKSLCLYRGEKTTDMMHDMSVTLLRDIGDMIANNNTLQCFKAYDMVYMQGNSNLDGTQEVLTALEKNTSLEIFKPFESIHTSDTSIHHLYKEDKLFQEIIERNKK